MTLHLWHDLDDTTILRSMLETHIRPMPDDTFVHWQGTIYRVAWTLQAIKETISGVWEVAADRQFGLDGWSANLHAWAGRDPVFRVEGRP